VWPEAIERAIARRLLGLDEPRFADIQLTRADFSRFQGKYELGVFDVNIVEREGRLRIEMPWPAPSSDLLYQGAGGFVAKDDPDVFHVSFSGEQPHAQRARVVFAGLEWRGLRR
jgi:hypothetical protein